MLKLHRKYVGDLLFAVFHLQNVRNMLKIYEMCRILKICLQFHFKKGIIEVMYVFLKKGLFDYAD